MADSESQKMFGGSVTSVGFGQLASKNATQSQSLFGSTSVTDAKTSSTQPTVFGSISSIGTKTPTASSATVCSEESSLVFGSGTRVVGFADLAASGSGVGDFSKITG